MSLTTVLIVLAVVVFVVARRLAGEPLEARKLLVLPLVLLAVGGWQLTRTHDVHHLTLDVTLLAIGGAVALAGGFVRGLTIKVFVRDGHLWSRYTWVTVGVWVLLIVLRLGQAYVDGLLGADQAVLTASLLPMLALSLLGEGALVARRAHASGAPFAPGRRSVRR